MTMMIHGVTTGAYHLKAVLIPTRPLLASWQSLDLQYLTTTTASPSIADRLPEQLPKPILNEIEPRFRHKLTNWSITTLFRAHALT